MFRFVSQGKRTLGLFMAVIFLISNVPVTVFASNNGPGAPEAAGFEPVDASDMVNLATGDFSYVLPLLSVPSPEGGYPVSLSYHGGIGYDQEASWVGLGWNLNPGAIIRNKNGFPDDWNNARVTERDYYETVTKGVTVGVGFGISNLSEMDVSVGLNWGSHRSIGGTVGVGIALGVEDFGGDKHGVTGGIDVGWGGDKGVSGSVGLYSGGFSASVSGSSSGYVGVNAGYTDGGAQISAGYSNMSGASVAMGVSQENKAQSARYSMGVGVGKNGASPYFGVSRGGAEKKPNLKGGYQSGSIGMSSFSQANTDVSGFNISVPFLPITPKFGWRKQVTKLDETNEFDIYGPFYFNDFNYQRRAIEDFAQYDAIENHAFRNQYMDMYEQIIPYESEEKLARFREFEQLETPSLTFPSYDGFTASGQGIGGTLRPYLLKNIPLIGEGKKQEYEDDKYYYSHYNFSSNNDKKIKSDEDKPSRESGYRFSFENGSAQSLIVSPHNIKTTSQVTGNENDIDDYLSNGSSVFKYTGDRFASDFVEVFTFTEANSLDSNPYNLNGQYFLKPKGFLKPEGVTNDAIAGYRITTANGTTYHYNYPVYQFEEVHRTLYNIGSDNENSYIYEDQYRETRQQEPYATHWLLTAITGPDYIQNNPNSYPDEGDFGYWVRFDYGVWTDGYVWKTPFDGFMNASFDQNENKRVPQITFGRKQLVYLNKIKTRTHSALFVKSVREDSWGKSLGMCRNDEPDAERLVFAKNDEGSYACQDGYTYGSNIFGLITPRPDINHQPVHYKSEVSLGLDEIILLTNENAAGIKPNDLSTNIGTSSSQYRNSIGLPSLSTEVINKANDTHQQYYAGWQTMPDNQIRLRYESQILDHSDISSTDYDKAIKVIRLKQDYSLASAKGNSLTDYGTPNSSASDAGKLTLNQVEFLGKAATSYMPPYEFVYNNNSNDYYKKYSTSSELAALKDPWGYRKQTIGSGITAWTMDKIKTPTGASIRIQHEKDDFYTEAFSRRYWENNIRWMFYRAPGDTNPDINLHLRIEKDPNVGLDVNFSNYFTIGDWIGSHFQVCRDSRNWGDNYDAGMRAEGVFKVIDVSADHLIIDLGFHGDRWFQIDIGDGNWTVIDDRWYSNTETTRSSNCDESDNASEGYTQFYIFNASKTPIEQVSGGLRVASVIVNDEAGSQYKTNYYYNDLLQSDGEHLTTLDPNYRSSGITSYVPIHGEKFVPYQTEVPAPQVYYEYVTVQAEVALNNEEAGYSVYHFNVYDVHEDIFDPNISMKNLFKATVDYPNNNNPDQALDSGKKLYAADIEVKINSADIGSLLSLSYFNSKGQMIKKTRSNYLDFDAKESAYANSTDILQESFYSMKSMFKGSESSPGLQKRVLSTSTRIEYPSVTASTEIVENGITTKSWASLIATDEYTGGALESFVENSGGYIIKNKVTPAYVAYPEMGSKFETITNRHMLSQTALEESFISNSPGSNYFNPNPLSANATIWNKNWTYRNFDGTQTTPTDNTEKIWRKLKSYVWNGEVDQSTGLYSGYSAFNFSNLPSNSAWLSTSEITQYDRFSAPVETMDINHNFSSSKYDPSSQYITSVGNAMYSEIYSTGFEYNTDGFTEGEVKYGGKLTNTQTDVHTGQQALHIGTNNAFSISFQSGEPTSELPVTVEPKSFFKDARPGRYKASMWIKNYNSGNAHYEAPLDFEFASGPNPNIYSEHFLIDDGIEFRFNGVEYEPEQQIVAGDWTQYIYYVDVPQNVAQNILSISGNERIVDDFRFHPIYASISSFVYDQDYGEVKAILGSNNMATKFDYDKGGRLIRTWQEVSDHNSQIGGFKLISENNYNFKYQ